MEDMRTAREWAAEGRMIRAGEKATHYVTDGTHGRAIFSHAQTTGPDLGETAGWRLVTREEWEQIKARKAEKDTRPYAKIRRALNGRAGIEIWVGNDKNLIATLKRGGYRFQQSRYWYHAERDFDTVATTLEEAGIRVNRVAE